MAAGAIDNGKPGALLYYDPRYYAANVFDPDGYSLEAVYKSWQHRQSLSLEISKDLCRCKKCEATDLTLRRGTDNNLAHVNIGGLLDREHDGSGDRVGRDRHFVHAIADLGLHFRTGHGFREICPNEAR